MHETDLPRTRAIAGRLDVRERAGSTNAELVAVASADPDAYPHLSVLLTADQRAGRGRLDRAWIAPPGAALAVSTLLRVPAIPQESRGWIPLLAGLSMVRAVRARGAAPAVLKWPNDVLVGERKVCGILAEAVVGSPDAVVVGAGVNTRMTPDERPVPTATSLAIEGAEIDDDALLADYLTGLDEQLRALAAAGGDADRSGLRGRVVTECVTVGRSIRVLLPGGGELAGVARDIRADGRLVVEVDGSEQLVAAGDVVHVR